MLFQVNAVPLGIQEVSVKLRARFCTSMHQDSFQGAPQLLQVTAEELSHYKHQFLLPQVFCLSLVWSKDPETSKYTAEHIPNLVFIFSWQYTPVKAVRMTHPKKLAMPAASRHAAIQTCYKIYLQMGIYPSWPYKNILYMALSSQWL